MLLQTWGEILTASFQQISNGVLIFIPKIIIALIIFLVGWIVAIFLGKVVSQILKATKVDNIARSLGFEEILARAGFHLDIGAFVGSLVKWFFIVVFLVAAVDVLGLSQVNRFLSDVVLVYLPNVIVAVFIVVISAIIAEAVRKAVIGGVKAANLPSANFLGAFVKWSIWIFAILAALYQLGVAAPFVQTLFIGVVGMLALASGLAFGLGGKELASRWLEKISEEISHKG